MQSVIVDKEKVLERLKTNREKHAEMVGEAIEGYKEELLEALATAQRDVAADKPFDHHSILSVTAPMDKTEEYDTAIEMMEMCLDDKVELTFQDFQHFIRDNWPWRNDFMVQNTKYMK